MSNELTFITAAIAASKRRTVWCYDEFVNTNVDEDVRMVLKEELADMMVSRWHRRCTGSILW